MNDDLAAMMSGEDGNALRGAIVVTGAGSGIGRAAALAVAARRAKVAALDISVSKAQETAAEASARGAPEAVAIECDVRDEMSIAGAIASAADRLGPVRGLVTCAGIDRGGLAHELAAERWHEVLATNLTGTFLACKHALIHMLAHGDGGSIVCASSPWAEVSAPGGASAYCASKGGVSSLVRSLALDYAARSIRVNAIVPGATETPLMWAGLPAEEIPGARTRIAGQLALGRLADPDEIAEGIVWLLSEHASYVTGSHLVVDGGLMARGSIES
jgi:NAD(P)-dependent dehydrogenase (short-subunit alcohol dehydrogenase family)